MAGERDEGGPPRGEVSVGLGEFGDRPPSAGATFTFETEQDGVRWRWCGVPVRVEGGDVVFELDRAASVSRLGAAGAGGVGEGPLRQVSEGPGRGPNALLIGGAEREALAGLRRRAEERPIHMPDVAVRVGTPEGKRAHMERMAELSVHVPTRFVVTFTVETGHPCGACRHMSISSLADGRVPTPQAAWVVAEELGFAGGLGACEVWLEKLAQGRAVNLLQPLDARAGASGPAPGRA